ncbi:MAG: GAF domain-containing protein, partial [Ignavibacteriae bacterium]|nr:GAF domain-containing protein [Ignavibacteriota bacterium]
MPSKLSLKVAREKIKRLDSLVEASQLLNSSLDLKKILGVLVDLATKHLDAERGTIYLIDRERKELWAEVLQKESIEIRLPLGKGIAGYVGKTGKTVNLRNAYKDRRFFKGIDRQSGYTTKTMLCTPMRNASNRIIGVFQILNKRSGYFN